MSGRECDMAIVGGGLAGGLIALAVTQARPDLRVRLIEAGPVLGGNHRWSWFASDLSPEGEALMGHFPHTRWDGGYDVSFRRFARHVPTPYRSLSSEDFAARLEELLPAGTILSQTAVTRLDDAGVTLESGERIAARAVLDCRGFVPTRHLTGGWQVFLGRRLRTAAPHGLDHPILMDATVSQKSGFRFMYVLPLGEHELFLEDTYYQGRPRVDIDDLMRRIERYAERRGWKGEYGKSEMGVLPVIAGGDFERWQRERNADGVARAGAHAGFVHPLTSYTLPFAVETALAMAAEPDLAGANLTALLEHRAREHWAQTRFYRRLASMLFGAAGPRGRWRIFARFYRLPTALIERFYAARSSRGDRLRIVCGRPPVRPWRAVRALLTSRRRLEVAG